MKKIALFGGTFDPIHNGHLKVAQEMLETYELDEVWFIPANVNPFKMGKEISPFQDRLKMVQLAIADYSQFKVLSIEGERPPPSYTIDTLRQLTSQEKNTKFHLIISDETAKDFKKWKESEEIIQLATPLVVKRDPLISATKIREKVREGLDFGDWVPKKIMDYIYKNRLYLKH